MMPRQDSTDEDDEASAVPCTQDPFQCWDDFSATRSRAREAKLAPLKSRTEAQLRREEHRASTKDQRPGQGGGFYYGQDPTRPTESSGQTCHKQHLPPGMYNDDSAPISQEWNGSLRAWLHKTTSYVGAQGTRRAISEWSGDDSVRGTSRTTYWFAVK